MKSIDVYLWLACALLPCLSGCGPIPEEVVGSGSPGFVSEEVVGIWATDDNVDIVVLRFDSTFQRTTPVFIWEGTWFLEPGHLVFFIEREIHPGMISTFNPPEQSAPFAVLSMDRETLYLDGLPYHRRHEVPTAPGASRPVMVSGMTERRIPGGRVTW